MEQTQSRARLADVLRNRPLLTLMLGHFTVDMYVGLLPVLYPLLTERFTLDLKTVGLVSLAATVMLIAPAGLWAQTPAAVPVATEFERLHFRSIGPATMSGRVADSHPGSWLSRTIPVARNPPWPSFSPS